MVPSGKLRRVALVITEDTILNSHRRKYLKSYISRHRLDLVVVQLRQMGGQLHRTSRIIHNFLWKGE
jgi:hypothetical protein